MNPEFPQLFVAHADARRIGEVSENQALRFFNVLSAAGYRPDSPDLELRARGGRNLTRLLRRTAAETPLNTFARLFTLGVPVPAAAARTAPHPIPLEEWCESGLMSRDSDWVHGMVAITPFEGFLLATERPELLDVGADPDYVPVVTNSTLSLVNFMVQRPFREVLDLGTGCGVLAFIAARQAEHVFASDLNNRAIQFARFNARFNGISNVEFATGSGFEPARGRKFDLIVANLPCVLGPASRYQYRDSGRELDSLGREIVAQVGDHLEEGGTLQSTIEWPNLGGADWKRRLSEWFPQPHCDALVIHLSTKESWMHAEETVFDTDVLDPREQLALCGTYGDYFEARNVTSVSEGLMALRRRSSGTENWTNLENLPNRRMAPFGDAVWDYFAVSDSVEQFGERLLDLRLRMAPSVSLTSAHRWDGKSWEETSYAMRQGAGFGFEASLDLRITNLVRSCDGSRTLREITSEIAAGAGVSFDAVAPGCLKVMGQMLQRGFVVLPEDGGPKAAGGWPQSEPVSG